MPSQEQELQDHQERLNRIGAAVDAALRSLQKQAEEVKKAMDAIECMKDVGRMGGPAKAAMDAIKRIENQVEATRDGLTAALPVVPTPLSNVGEW